MRLLDEPEVISWRALLEAFRVIYRQLENALLMEECSIPRFQILFHLYFDGPLAASVIAKRLFVTRGNMSMFVKRLLADKLIEPAYEGRSKGRPAFRLTSRGAVLFEEIFPRHIKRVRRLMLPLNQDLVAELRRVLAHALEQDKRSER